MGWSCLLACLNIGLFIYWFMYLCIFIGWYFMFDLSISLQALLGGNFVLVFILALRDMIHHIYRCMVYMYVVCSIYCGYVMCIL